MEINITQIDHLLNGDFAYAKPDRSEIFWLSTPNIPCLRGCPRNPEGTAFERLAWMDWNGIQHIEKDNILYGRYMQYGSLGVLKEALIIVNGEGKELHRWPKGAVVRYGVN